MGLEYSAVQWNRQKRIYDFVLVGGVGAFSILFGVLSKLLFPFVTDEIMLMKAFGAAAFILLHVILGIGPLCRLNPRFLPLLYNRRHLERHARDGSGERTAFEDAQYGICVFGETRTLWALGAKVALALLLFITPAAQAAVREVGAIGITVGELDRVLPFYTNTLPFELKGVTTASGAGQDALLGLNGTQTRSAELQLGSERIILTEFLIDKGRPIPADSRSFDHWFQHIAIVVSDMDRAYEHLRRAKVRHISTLPQTLPAWNKDAGGIKAFYFRDPEDHVLEIIWFPPDKGDPKWRQLARTGSDTGAPLFLGIDHTAIVVSDTERSLAFYTNALGLRVAGGAENYGTEQEHLNQVFGARLRITALRAERGPGIEFLEYITPPGGRPLPDDAEANDLVFWNSHLLDDDVKESSTKLHESGARFVSRTTGSLSQIVRDPDGHALRLVPLRTVTSAAK